MKYIYKDIKFKNLNAVAAAADVSIYELRREYKKFGSIESAIKFIKEKPDCKYTIAGRGFNDLETASCVTGLTVAELGKHYALFSKIWVYRGREYSSVKRMANEAGVARKRLVELLIEGLKPNDAVNKLKSQSVTGNTAAELMRSHASLLPQSPAVNFLRMQY